MTKNYDEYSHIDIIEYGLNTFSIMSTDYFTYLKAEIDLLNEINFTHDLELHARQFCEIAMTSIGQSTPNHQVHEDHFDKTSLLVAWKDFFTYLEKIGYDKVILTWFDHLMRVKKHFATRLHSWWEDILLYWRKIEKIDNGPNLPQLINQQITILLLQERVRNFEWCCKPRLWMESDKDVWSRYVMKSLGNSTWMRGMIVDYGLLKMWAEIFRILTEEELAELDRWGKSVFEKLNEDGYGYFSLVQFAQDLKTHGY